MIIYEDSLAHHGIKGQKWGERNGPPYPLKRSTDLKSFDREPITNATIKKYKSQAPQLSHVRVTKNTYGELYSKDGKIVGMVNTEKKDDGNIWIQGIEVFGDNQGKGIGHALLDHAVKDLNATHLSVNKKNIRAKGLYDKYGFNTYDEDDTMYYMRYGDDLYLEHHGIKGMKWGIRRYQNPDGSLTPEGRKRYAQKNLKNAKVRNLDKWGMDENHNVLYIIGASGSGKSTTARGLANDNDSIIHLDTLFENTERGTASTRNKDFELYCIRKGIDVKKARDSSANVADRRAVIRDISNQVEPYGKQCYDKGRRVIVEGVQMADDTMFADKRYFKDKATITLHTSKMRSAIRAATRDKKNAKDIFADVTDKERADWYDYVNDQLKIIDDID